MATQKEIIGKKIDLLFQGLTLVFLLIVSQEIVDTNKAVFRKTSCQAPSREFKVSPAWWYRYSESGGWWMNL